MTDGGDRKADRRHRRPSGRIPAVVLDLPITLALWIYFIFGFLFFFAPFYALGLPLPRVRTRWFQCLNHYFYRSFFGMCRVLIPGLKWQIDPAVRRLSSSVIICNHISYIDAILMISLFKRHTTIVKERLFFIPVFGWLLRLFGYLPSAAGGPLAALMVQRMDTLCSDMARGVNVFVFPEGTRSRDGRIAPFNPGAFKIARLCHKPIVVAYIRNANKLFQPGRFLFHTRSREPISLTLIGRIDPDYDNPRFSLGMVMQQARDMMISEGRKEEDTAY